MCILYKSIYLGEDVERREGGHVLANYEQKGGEASNIFNPCWNCKSTDHQARKCPTQQSAKVRDMIEERNQKRDLLKQKSRQVSNPNKYENHSEQKDKWRQRDEYDDDGDEYEEEV